MIAKEMHFCCSANFAVIELYAVTDTLRNSYWDKIHTEMLIFFFAKIVIEIILDACHNVIYLVCDDVIYVTNQNIQD